MSSDKCDLLISSVVWAVDLDDADSISAQFLKSGGSNADSNGFSIKKLKADNQQAVANKIAYWTPCMSDSDRKKLGCPGGELNPPYLPNIAVNTN
jgi:chitinase